ncbi:MAG: TetR family transcriptional regulator [Clostridium sp.]|uniref:TetR family transcriptional regulator n=1 Tax=Clostridium sp. TaxID=1506 RepID=UPI0030312FC9
MSPKISDDKRQEQVNKIIDGAIKVFRIKGYEQTTMKDIRESAGVSTGSLYMYFSNKEEIFIRVLEDTIIKQDLKKPLNKQENCWGKIEAYIENVKDYCNNIQDGIAPIAYEYSISAWRDEERRKFINERYDLGVTYIKGIIQEGINLKEFSKDVDVDRIGNFVIVVFEGINTITVSLGNKKINIEQQLDLLKYILDKELK